MTHRVVYQGSDKIILERESHGCSGTMYAAGGLFIVLWWGLLLPARTSFPNLEKTLIIGFGIAFASAAIYIPYILRMGTPQSSLFDLEAGLLQIKMANGSMISIPFSEILTFEIEPEQRSPSASNSIGVNYIHYHINLRRKNQATWEITSTTKKTEADKTLQLLRNSVDLNSIVRVKKFERPIQVVDIKGKEPIEIRWPDHVLEIFSKKVVHKTFSSIHGKEVKEISIADFLRVEYSFSTIIDRPKSHILIFIKSTDVDAGEKKLRLKLNKLNPIECLELEYWLHQELSERKALLEVRN